LSALCRKSGILVAIDGAHAIGHVPVNLNEIGCDFYCSNNHKWLFAPKGSAFFFVKKQHQSWIHPVITSHHWKSPDWTKRFHMQGTNDASAYIATGDALTFVETIGWNRMDAYRRELLGWVIAQAQQRWKDTQLICTSLNMRGYMALLSLPIPETDEEKKTRRSARTQIGYRATQSLSPFQLAYGKTDA